MSIIIPKSKKARMSFLISAAVQSPSSHNTQPWLFRIENNKIYVKADLSRALKQGDPENRELYASVGAATQNICLAAKTLGMTPKLELFPKKSKIENLVATVEILSSNSATKVNEKILSAIWDRRTNRTPYDPSKNLPVKIAEKIIQIAHNHDVELTLVEHEQSIKKIAKMIENGMKEFLNKKSFRQELSGWIRHDWSKKGDGLPGYSLGMPGIVSIIAPLLIQSTSAIDEVAGGERKVVESCSTVGVISVKSNSKLSWVKTGMAFQDIAIELHLKGISTAILTAAIESPKERVNLKKLIKHSEPSLFFRVGYATGGGIAVPRRGFERVSF